MQSYFFLHSSFLHCPLTSARRLTRPVLIPILAFGAISGSRARVVTGDDVTHRRGCGVCHFAANGELLCWGTTSTPTRFVANVIQETLVRQVARTGAAANGTSPGSTGVQQGTKQGVRGSVTLSLRQSQDARNFNKVTNPVNGLGI